MSIEKPRIPRKSKNLNVNDDNRLLLFSDELKKQYPISNNIYFSLEILKYVRDLKIS